MLYLARLLACRNEKDVGSAIRKSGIPREEIFVTTKVTLWLLCYLLSVYCMSRKLTVVGLEFVSWKGKCHQGIKQQPNTVKIVFLLMAWIS